MFLHAIIIAVFASFSCLAQAKSERVYVLGEADEPIQIKKKAPSTEVTVMRDPNLMGAKKPVASQPMHEKKPVAYVKKTPKKAPVAFKPLKVAGSVRMPRVEFGRVALPVGMREESPDTNFVTRSLLRQP